MSRCFMDDDFKEIKALPDLWDLQRLEMQGVGLIFITGIDRKFPNLISLDLKQNKIYSMEAINVLYECKNLAEVNYIDNPICVHRDLIHMVEEAAP